MCLFTIKQNQTQPAAATQLLYNDAAFALQLTDVVEFSLLDAVTYIPIFTQACVVTDAANGAVEYRWSASDTAVRGLYAAQFVVTRGSNKIVIPSDTYHLVDII